MKRFLLWAVTVNVAAMLILFSAGCHTTSPTLTKKSPLVDWDGRIGNYTYNLALQDLGVPVRSTTLSDGTIVAEWLTSKGAPGTPASASPDTSEAESGGVYASPMLWDNPPRPSTPQTPNRYLRLTFGPDQKLTGWRKFWQYYQPTSS